MKDFTELRSQERIDFDTPVVYSDPALKHHKKAMMYNFSDGGMYFVTTEHLRPGSEVYVKTVNYCSVNKCEVRWCNRIKREETETFGVGLQCEL